MKWFKKKMAEEEKKASTEKTEDAVDAEDLRVKKEGESTGRGKDSASTEKPAEPDWKALYALTLADFDNYKKRAARDREDTYRYAEADILKDVLPAIDNLALALANAPHVDAGNNEATASTEKNENSTAFAAFVKGVQLVYDSVLKSFKDHGAEPFDSIGQELDPEKMEAIAHLPSSDFDEGKVSVEVKKGWMLKGKLLRAAQVVVSSGKPPAPATEQAVADQSDSRKQP